MLREESDTLVLEEPTKEDSGRYFCKIVNSLGYKETQTDIEVHGMSGVMWVWIEGKPEGGPRHLGIWTGFRYIGG